MILEPGPVCVIVEGWDLGSYGGQVHVCTQNGMPGTEYPRGTSFYPVDNLEDAIKIANDRGLEIIRKHDKV